MGQVNALGYVTLVTATGLRCHTISMLALGITDGLTAACLFRGVTLTAEALIGLLAATMLPTLWAALGLAYALLGSHIACIAVTFFRPKATAVRSTLLLADRITLARLHASCVALLAFALIGRFLAELMGSTAGRAHWHTSAITIFSPLKVRFAFANFRRRAELVQPAISGANWRTVAILG